MIIVWDFDEFLYDFKDRERFVLSFWLEKDGWIRMKEIFYLRGMELFEMMRLFMVVLNWVDFFVICK